MKILKILMKTEKYTKKSNKNLLERIKYINEKLK